METLCLDLIVTPGNNLIKLTDEVVIENASAEAYYHTIILEPDCDFKFEKFEIINDDTELGACSFILGDTRGEQLALDESVNHLNGNISTIIFNKNNLFLVRNLEETVTVGEIDKISSVSIAVAERTVSFTISFKDGSVEEYVHVDTDVRFGCLSSNVTMDFEIKYNE